jgi:hypothetical protein
VTTLDTDDFIVTNLGVGFRGWYGANVSIGPIDIDTVLGSNIFLVFEKNGAGDCSIAIMKCTIEMTIPSVQAGLNEKD